MTTMNSGRKWFIRATELETNNWQLQYYSITIAIINSWKLKLEASFGSHWKTLFEIISHLNSFSFDDFEKLYSNLSTYALYYRILKCGVPGEEIGLSPFDHDSLNKVSRSLALLVNKWDVKNSNDVSLKNVLQLQKPSPKDEVDQLEELMRTKTSSQDFQLHPHFRLLYTLFNGQLYDISDIGTSPLFGIIQVYDRIIMPFLLPLNLVMQNIHNQRGRASAILSAQGLIPIVINPYHDSFQWYFENSTGRILCPRLDLINDDYSGYYVIADDIFKFLELAGRMVSETAERIENNEKLHFVSGFSNPVSKRTGCYNITVRTAFLFGESSVMPPQYHYAYEIIQSMDDNGNFSLRNIQLTNFFRPGRWVNETRKALLENRRPSRKYRRSRWPRWAKSNWFVGNLYSKSYIQVLLVNILYWSPDHRINTRRGRLSKLKMVRWADFSLTVNCTKIVHIYCIRQPSNYLFPKWLTILINTTAVAVVMVLILRIKSTSLSFR